MSARLTLLLLCDQTELHSAFTNALLAAGFQLLIQHQPGDAKTVLSHLSVDAIMIRHNAIADGSAVAAELKFVAPRTPIIFFPAESNYQGPRRGIDSVCRADPHDEIIARAVAVFFHQAMTRHSPHQPINGPFETVRHPEPDSEPLLTA
jgi:hypothetical protein